VPPAAPGVPRRGDVYWVNLDPVVGSEQGGLRPALVISPDAVNRVFPVVVVAPITSQIKDRNSPIAPLLPAGQPLPKESAVLTFQVRTLDRGRLRGLAGTLTPDQMSAVERGLAISLGLPLPSRTI
jgi:mRNA interferase MazF